MMINITELKRKVIDEFLTSQSLVTNTPFKSVAKIYTGESTNAEEKNKYSVKTDDCYPYVSTKDISIKGSVNFENGMYIPKGKKKFSIAPVNSILLCIEGGNAGNKIAIVKEATCFVNKLCCFDIFGADNRFIYYYLLSNQFRNNFKEQMTGLIGGVSVKKLKELILPLPHITEQKRIADKLDVIFAELDKIDEKQTRLATIQEKMEAKILKLAIQGKLTEQLASDGDSKLLIAESARKKQEYLKLKKIELNEPEEEDKVFSIPVSWNWAKLSNISQIESGGTPSRSEKKYWNGTIPWLKIGDLNSKCVTKSSEYITELGLKNSSARIFKRGTILYTIFATIGVVSILDIDASTNQAIAGLSFFGNIDRDYLYYVLVELKNILVGKSHGMTQSNINLTILKNIFIPIPPLEEQKRVVAKIEQLLPLCRRN